MALNHRQRTPRRTRSLVLLATLAGAGLVFAPILALGSIAVGSTVDPGLRGASSTSGVPTSGLSSSCTGGTTTSVTSSNWAGYAAQSCLSSPASKVVTFVQGSWVQPKVTCKSGQTAYAAFWVGIDGYSSSSVEQLGTDSDCASGSPSYYAWYEIYPKAPVNFALTISPGDAITASVTYTSSHFVLQITDSTTGQTAKTTQSYAGAKRNSAEWVAEAPSSGSGVLPLADFGSVTFTSCSATFSGTTGSISDTAWQDAQMTMASGSTTKATTSGLTSGGGSFTTTWKHS